MIAAFWAFAGYLLGSIPFGIVITRLLGLGDLRQIGSGNIGATNVLRTGHKGAALATLLLDSGKGAIAVLLARWLGGDIAAVVAGAGAILGHCFPVWLGFRGGKGVATFLGTVIALSWPLGLMCCAIWLVAAAIFRISSLAALIAATASPLIAVAMGQSLIAAAVAFMAALVIFRHRENIQRLRAGTEPRIGRKL
ncbi:glycerol-3-phosphate 1-O-acyltransferase PlsY [Paracoccus jeotgali]|uniref:glycerol-3-phosphate 1-O-acyltransferase PlsY n=1 Tax=Paracoccus jeotgali TaxID=2065379 RepID=UPI0028AE08F6|nr:glycerol-3-phosphate 1-O-acyltransferase PlsY [Paracoccus jeotgali]